MPWTLKEIAAGLTLLAVNVVIACALALALASQFNILIWK